MSESANAETETSGMEFTYKFLGCNLEWVIDTFLYLGVSISKNLSWSAQYEHTTAKQAGSLVCWNATWRELLKAVNSEHIWCLFTLILNIAFNLGLPIMKRTEKVWQLHAAYWIAGCYLDVPGTKLHTNGPRRIINVYLKWPYQPLCSVTFSFWVYKFIR